MKEKKILQVINSAKMGGGPVHLHSILRRLRDQGARVVVAVSDDGPFVDKLRTDGFEVETIDMMSSRFNFKASNDINDLLRRFNPDLIHMHGTRAAFFGVLGKISGRKIPSVYTVHGLSFNKDNAYPKKIFYRMCEKFIVKNVDITISVSGVDKVIGFEKKVFGLSDKVVTVYNGLDMKLFKAPKKKSDNGTYTVGTVARLVPQKGVEYLVRAAKLILKQKDNVRFIIVGAGPLELKLRRLARKLGVDHIMEFLGEKEDVRDYLAKFDVFVLPSLWEGFPISILEAFAMEKPVIATSTSGAVELIKDGENGILITPKDETKICNAILKLMGDEKRSKKMSETGRRVVEENFTIDKMLDMTMDIYSELLNNGNGNGYNDKA